MFTISEFSKGAKRRKRLVGTLKEDLKAVLNGGSKFGGRAGGAFLSGGMLSRNSLDESWSHAVARTAGVAIVGTIIVVNDRNTIIPAMAIGLISAIISSILNMPL